MFPRWCLWLLPNNCTPYSKNTILKNIWGCLYYLLPIFHLLESLPIFHLLIWIFANFSPAHFNLCQFFTCSYESLPIFHLLLWIFANFSPAHINFCQCFTCSYESLPFFGLLIQYDPLLILDLLIRRFLHYLLCSYSMFLPIYLTVHTYDPCYIFWLIIESCYIFCLLIESCYISACS